MVFLRKEVAVVGYCFEPIKESRYVYRLIYFLLQFYFTFILVLLQLCGQLY